MQKVVSLVLLFAVLIMVGCAAHVHTVGQGAAGGQMEEARQWYILYGLVPLNDVDTQEMAAGEEDYTITTQMAPIDIVIGFFTSMITVQSRTVTVEK